MWRWIVIIMALALMVWALPALPAQAQEQEPATSRAREEAGPALPAQEQEARERMERQAREGRERIERFHSRIEVNEDGSLRVVETITVWAAGREIRRGIYRDFPTVYRGRLLTRLEVPFEVEEVLRDGEPEAWHTEMRSNGVRVYMGEEGRRLAPWRYTYTIRYTTSMQLGHFEDHDELYWNVTGDDWSFPIEYAFVELILPEAVPRDRIEHEGFTGRTGARGEAYESRVEADSGQVQFRTTRPLSPGEGLTIVVGWPKGFVAEPTAAERRAALMRSNRALWYGLVGLAGVLGYYLIAWMMVGRDPDRGTIVPRFEPPLGLSPAAMRFVDRMGYDNRCFAAAVIDMAVKGVVRIEEESDGTYALIRLSEDESKLSSGQKRIARHLLTSDRLTLKQTNHSRIGKAVEDLRTFLNLEYEGKLFYKNRQWLIPGLALSVVAFAASVVLGASDRSTAIFMSFWLTIWTIGVIVLLWKVQEAWRDAIARRSVVSGAGATFATLFALPFVGGELVGLWMLSSVTSIWLVPVLLGIAGINFLFFGWLKRPTLAGQRVRDQIEGFRMYLSAAEADSLRWSRAPARSPELFEQYLPYALALGVETRWAEQFASVLSAAGRTDGAYRPGWYHGGGRWSGVTTAGFASGLGSSLSGAISSSSSAPGSSSGFSGGSSGGGGGGGGW